MIRYIIILLIAMLSSGCILQRKAVEANIIIPKDVAIASLSQMHKADAGVQSIDPLIIGSAAKAIAAFIKNRKNPKNSVICKIIIYESSGKVQISKARLPFSSFEHVSIRSIEDERSNFKWASSAYPIY